MTNGFHKIIIALLLTAAALMAAPYARAGEAGSKHLEEARVTFKDRRFQKKRRPVSSRKRTGQWPRAFQPKMFLSSSPAG
jgi:2-methylcitrate dehydratase PrpD